MLERSSVAFECMSWHSLSAGTPVGSKADCPCLLLNLQEAIALAPGSWTGTSAVKLPVYTISLNRAIANNGAVPTRELAM